MKQIPLIYHPTTLFWVDDDSLFLNIATERFKEDYTIKVSHSPREAINFFTGYQSHITPSIFFRGLDEYEDYDLTDHLPVDLDFYKLREVRNNNTKLEDIAVMIVDYRMPEMSGIDLCKHLSLIPTKKILLTGEADYQEAIHAFNNGFINYFICKDDPNIDTILCENVDKLSQEYFIEHTKPILHHIEANKKLPQSDPIFACFFNKLYKDKNIKEYYISDKNGGVLLVDNEEKLLYLVIHTEQTLNDFTELHYKDSDATFFIKNVESRSKIPFFGIGKEAWGKEPKFWANHFFSPNIIDGREKYYYALISL